MLNDMEVEKVSRRLRRIQGQVGGIEKMVQDHRQCIDVLQQIAAARAALYQVGMAMLESHSQSCVGDAIQKGHEKEAIDELMRVYKALHK